MSESTKIDRYFIRTTEHIHRVQKNMLELVTTHRIVLGLTDGDCRKLMHNVFNHDRSKFSPEQFEPYVELTEYFYQRKTLGNKEYDYPIGCREKVNEAIDHHYKNENHHPEIFEVGSLGKWDKFEAYETVCDLHAMAQEFNEGSCRNYWLEVWRKKHFVRFYDDYNWSQIEAWMGAAIRCFDGEKI